MHSVRRASLHGHVVWFLQYPVDIEARECGVSRTPAVDGRTMRSTIVNAEPQPIACDLERTALVIIDMQRDFLEPGGFGELLGNNVSLLKADVVTCRTLISG